MAELSYDFHTGIFTGNFLNMYPDKGQTIDIDIDNPTLVQFSVNDSQFTKTKAFEAHLAKKSKEAAERLKSFEKEENLRIAKEKNFCYNLVDRVPKNAVPRSNSPFEYTRACSNLWQAGTEDFYTCVKWWRDCEKHW